MTRFEKAGHLKTNDPLSETGGRAVVFIPSGVGQPETLSASPCGLAVRRDRRDAPLLRRVRLLAVDRSPGLGTSLGSRQAPITGGQPHLVPVAVDSLEGRLADASSDGASLVERLLPLRT